MCTGIDMGDLITVHHEQGTLNRFSILEKKLLLIKVVIYLLNKVTSNTTNNTKTCQSHLGMEQIQVTSHFSYTFYKNGNKRLLLTHTQ